MVPRFEQASFFMYDFILQMVEYFFSHQAVTYKRGELEEGGPKIKTFSHENSRYQGRDRHRDDFSRHCCVIHRKIGQRVNPGSSHHRENMFFFFSSLFSFYCVCVKNGCSLNLTDNHFTV